MYKINNQNHYKYLSLSDIYCGIKNNVLDKSVASNFIEFLINDNKIDIDLVIDFLASENLNTSETLSTLKKIINKTNISDKYSIDKLKYILLIEVSEQISNHNELLEKIDDIYSNFDYPEDLIPFIPYMPNNFQIEFKNQNEYQEFTVQLFEKYIAEAKNIIQSMQTNE